MKSQKKGKEKLKEEGAVVCTLGRQVAQSVERRTVEAGVRGSKPVLGTWWLGRIPPNQPYSTGAAPAATTLLAEW